MRPAGVCEVRLAAGMVRLPVWECGAPGATITAMSRRILIVDDHPGFRASARRMLEAGGFEVVGEAEDGSAAMGAASALNPDLVLLDVQLPDANGIDLAARISADGGPGVVLTSSRPSDQLDLSDTTAVGFIPKDELSPSRITELLR